MQKQQLGLQGLYASSASAVLPPVCGTCKAKDLNCQECMETVCEDILHNAPRSAEKSIDWRAGSYSMSASDNSSILT